MRIGELERHRRAAGATHHPLGRLTDAGQQLVDDTQARFQRIEQSVASVRDLSSLCAAGG